MVIENDYNYMNLDDEFGMIYKLLLFMCIYLILML